MAEELSSTFIPATPTCYQRCILSAEMDGLLIATCISTLVLGILASCQIPFFITALGPATTLSFSHAMYALSGTFAILAIIKITLHCKEKNPTRQKIHRRAVYMRPSRSPLTGQQWMQIGKHIETSTYPDHERLSMHITETVNKFTILETIDDPLKQEALRILRLVVGEQEATRILNLAATERLAV